MAQRAGYRCSNPDCGIPTRGAASDDEHIISVGIAAHITAASPGGPRYDPTLTKEKRRITEIESSCVTLTVTLSILMIRISPLKSSSSGNDLLSSGHSLRSLRRYPKPFNSLQYMLNGQSSLDSISHYQIVPFRYHLLPQPFQYSFLAETLSIFQQFFVLVVSLDIATMDCVGS